MHVKLALRSPDSTTVNQAMEYKGLQGKRCLTNFWTPLTTTTAPKCKS